MDIQQCGTRPRVFSFRLAAKSRLRQRDADFLRHRPHCFRESYVFDFLYELENVSLFAAAKAVIELLGRVHGEGRGLLFVKRAQPRIILRSRFSE